MENVEAFVIWIISLAFAGFTYRIYYGFISFLNFQLFFTSYLTKPKSGLTWVDLFLNQKNKNHKNVTKKHFIFKSSFKIQ